MADKLTVYLSGDAWNGDAAASVTVNGVAVGGSLDVAAVNATDAVQAFTFTGNFGSAPIVGVSFTNDASSGLPLQDRNLYLDGFAYNGVMQLNDKQELSYDQTIFNTLSSTPAQAERAADFLGSVGVDVHLDSWDTSYGLGGGQWGGNTPRVAASLAYLGVGHIRVGVPTADTLPEMQALAAKGIKFDVLLPSVSSIALLPTQLASIDALADSVTALEGPNETNLTSSFSWNGQSGYAAAAAYQAALYAAVKADPKLSGDAVYALSLGGVGADAYQQLGNLSTVATNGNIHVYYINGTPPASTIKYGLGLAAVATPGIPTVITETNYTSAPAITGSVSENVQARYDLDLLMDATKDGVKATYFYELLDEQADPTQAYNEEHYGLFHADGTPKPAATAMHNLMSILADNGSTAASFKTGNLSYSISGLPASGNSLLIEKSNGAYDLAVWAEPEIWNVASGSDIAAPVRQVTVALDAPASKAVVYDPLTGSTPIATYSAISSVSVAITDHPLIIELESSQPTAGPASIGAGADTLALTLSEDAFQGDAQFTVTVDGKQIGGTQTVTASHGAGQTQLLNVLGTFAAGTHTASLNFLNDLYTPGVGDRNLYLDSASIDGKAAPAAHLALMSVGAQSFTFVSGPLP